MILQEDIFDDVVEIEVPAAETDIEVLEVEPLEGPQTPEEVGMASLLLSAIANSTNNIDQYNVIKANCNDEEIGNVIDDIVANENITLGKLQGVLKQVSPNAENIMSGAVEVEQELTESLNEGSEDHYTNVKDWAERIADYTEIIDYSTEVALDKFPENKEEILSVALDCRNTFTHLVDRIRSTSESLNEDIADYIQHVHDKDEYLWNLHNTDYSWLYDQLEKYGFGSEDNPSIADCIRQMPKSKQEQILIKLVEPYNESLGESWSGRYSPSFLQDELNIDKNEAKEFSIFLYDNHADEGYKAMRDIADDYARLYDGKSALEYWYDEFKRLDESFNEDYFSKYSWPNGEPVSKDNLIDALQYMYGFGMNSIIRKLNNNDFTNDEIQMAINYFADKNESLDEDIYRQYEDPYKLEDELERLNKYYEENPEEYDDYAAERIAELKDRINFAWQDDEYNSSYNESFKEDWAINNSGNPVYLDDKEDIPIYSGDEQDASILGWKHRISNRPLMSEDEFITYFFEDDLEGLAPGIKNNLYSMYKNSYNQKREFKDGRIFPDLNNTDESLEDINDIDESDVEIDDTVDEKFFKEFC